MLALLLISVFVLALASIVYLRFIKSRAADSAQMLPPPSPRDGLFTDTNAAPAEDERATKYNPRLKSLAADLRARAAKGEHSALTFAHEVGEPRLYDELLCALVERARTSPGELRALAVFVTKNRQLRGNAALSEAVLDDLVRTPDPASARHALYVAARSDDAALYDRAVKSASRLWREGKLAGLAPEKLAAQLESDYWVLDDEARASGAGFVLKQTLAEARRELVESAGRAASQQGEN